MRKNINIILKKNILIILLMISMCPILGFSYARFVINTDSYRSNEMYMTELLYTVKIDDVSTYTLTIDAGANEEEHIIEITSLNAVSTNYKLIYQNNSNVKIEFASDDWYLVYGNIIKVNKTHIRVTNLTEEEQTIEFNIVGGYYFNEVGDIKVPEGYTDFYEEYWYFDYETLALYVNNTRVKELDTSKYYDLVSYTCSNFDSSIEVLFNTDTQTLNVPINKQTKCSLYFEEIDNPVYTFDYTGTMQTFVSPRDGYYKLEVWGAQGGGSKGGYGAYSIGYFDSIKDKVLSIIVGGTTSNGTGGYNGGGSITGNSYGGGGATHIATISGLLSSLSSNKSSILIVAAGGGGTGNGYAGGNGGGITGNNGSGDDYGKGGTQSAGGSILNSCCGSTAGSFGKGGSASWSNESIGGGGAGYYGGSSGGGSGANGGGGGGSSYIGNSLLVNKYIYCYNCTSSTDESTKTLINTCANSTPTENCSKIGNGYARITYVGNIN